MSRIDGLQAQVDTLAERVQAANKKIAELEKRLNAATEVAHDMTHSRFLALSVLIASVLYGGLVHAQTPTQYYVQFYVRTVVNTPTSATISIRYITQVGTYNVTCQRQENWPNGPDTLIVEPMVNPAIIRWALDADHVDIICTSNPANFVPLPPSPDGYVATLVKVENGVASLPSESSNVFYLSTAVPVPTPVPVPQPTPAPQPTPIPTPTPQPVCVAKPLKITGVKWPKQVGSTSGSWTANKPLAVAIFSWTPQAFLGIDQDGCQVKIAR